MSRFDNLQSQQLSMFMSAREIKDQYQPSDGDREKHTTWTEEEGFKTHGLENDDQLWQRKSSEADDYLFDGPEGIEEVGVKNPVWLGTAVGSSGKPQIAGGHHRIAAKADTFPDELIPVLHNEGGVVDAKSAGMNSYVSRKTVRGYGGYITGYKDIVTPPPYRYT